MAGRAGLRASDADRERAVERLRRATAEGRLMTEELEHRLESALSARTYGQLEALLSDLPGRGLTRRRRQRPVRWLPAAIGLAIAIPLVLAALALIVQVAVGVLAAWCVWAAVGWFVFGRRPRGPWGMWHRACRPWRGRATGMRRHSRTYWV
jgi:hypothetical protein